MSGAFNLYFSYNKWLVNLKLESDTLKRMATFIHKLDMEKLNAAMKEEAAYFTRCAVILKRHINSLQNDIRYFTIRVSARMKKTKDLERPPDEHLFHNQLRQRYHAIRREVGILDVRFSLMKKSSPTML